MNCPIVFVKYKGIFFSSFFAAAMVAAVYAYFSYKFSRFNFVDFSEWALYSQSDLFTPQDDAYILLVYSSSQEESAKIIERIRNRRGIQILAIDLAQNNTRCDAKGGAICLTGGINVLLNYVHRFNVVHSPSAFVIERQNGAVYKQATLVEKI